MGLFQRKYKTAKKGPDYQLDRIQRHFKNFQNILECNNLALKTISDLKEKSNGEYIFDKNYILESLKELKKSIDSIIYNINEMSDEKYKSLKSVINDIETEIDNIVQGRQIIPDCGFTMNLNEIASGMTNSVGSKNLHISDLKRELDIPIPKGFAITTRSYKYFLEANNLREEINRRINSIDIKDYSVLENISKDIREIVAAAKVPEDLSESILDKFNKLKTAGIDYVSVRSSAVGEDTHLSFAGQYATFLGVGEKELINRYRDVIASKFTPKSIYYYLSHDLIQSQLAMSVGVMEMIDAKTSGVIYTKDPLHQDEDHLFISATYGLGKMLVDGRISPDYIRVSRTDGTINYLQVSPKLKKLSFEKGKGVLETEVPDYLQNVPSLNESKIKLLTDLALKIEEFYGQPQDIEWALDYNGDPFILQARPLKVLKTTPPVPKKEFSHLKKLYQGGITISPGAGAGPVYKITPSTNFADVPDGIVIITPNTFPGLIALMNKVNGILACEGSPVCHSATLAREFKIPTIVGNQNILNIPVGTVVTVDSTDCIVYEGYHEDLIEELKPEFDNFQDDPLFILLENVLKRILPLNLLNPADNDFKASSCKTYHDIIRFTHQMSMKEMFESAHKLDKTKLGKALRTVIPLDVKIIYVDRDPDDLKNLDEIGENSTGSVPMDAFWSGILKEGWPKTTVKKRNSGLASLSNKNSGVETAKDFSQESFAILGKEFMIISLKMGYHFSTIEALCTDNSRKNYIKMQFNDGGASMDRRSRRIMILTEILNTLGFVNTNKEDFLDTSLNYTTKENTLEKLYILGRLSILTKQLDMTLFNDSIAKWYVKEFSKKLGIKH